MYAKLAFIADSVTIDQANKMTAVGMFDTVFASKFPAVHRDMTVAARIEGSINEKGDHELSIEFRDEKANRLGGVKLKVALTDPGVGKGSLQFGLIVKIQDLPFASEGQYEFVLFVDDRFLCRIPFAVRKVREVGNG